MKCTAFRLEMHRVRAPKILNGAVTALVSGQMVETRAANRSIAFRLRIRRRSTWKATGKLSSHNCADISGGAIL